MQNAKRVREYRAFPANVERKQHARHGRQCDDATPSRERILRPLDAAPRRQKDWQ